eukprot:356128-Rhodomonas_salina.1
MGRGWMMKRMGGKGNKTREKGNGNGQEQEQEGKAKMTTERNAKYKSESKHKSQHKSEHEKPAKRRRTRRRARAQANLIGAPRSCIADRSSVSSMYPELSCPPSRRQPPHTLTHFLQASPFYQ